MLNLIYESFPYGSSETFVEYEIPYLNQLVGDKFRVFSFYRGNDEKRNIHLNGELYLIKPVVKDYVLGFLTLTPKMLLREIKAISKRVCPDPIIRCLWRMLYYRAYGYALYRKVKELDLNQDEVFASYWLSECAYSAVMLKKWYPHISVTSRGHGFDVYEERCCLPFRKTIFEKIDYIYTVNEVEKRYILRRHSEITSDRIRISHLGIELPKEYSPRVDRKPFKIITCSSVIQLKRLDLLIDALEEIDDIELEWYHIGGGLLLDQISELAEKKLCKKNQKHFFLGQLSLTDVHKHYQDHDYSAFINCSDTEGIPVSIMEAMSYGIPVIARNIGGISEIVGDDAGLLINPEGNPHMLSKAIKYIYSLSDNEYYRLRENARKRVIDSFDAKKQYAEYFALLLGMNKED
ncbi:MAG: glycosyltransferase [Clostridia bacterium]|nr:glycosyltransferase [Clostridia bacterium]